MTDVRTPEPPKPPREPRRLGARDALVAVGVAVLLLVLIEGPSIRNSGERMDDGLWRTVVLAVGKPADAIGDVIPLPEIGDELTAWLSPDDDRGGPGSFEAAAQPEAGEAGIPPVTPDYFDPRAIGVDPPEPRELDTVLVTGDSLAMPLDVETARRMAETDEGVEVQRDPHVGTGISKSGLLDWGRLSTDQVREDEPDAVVVFIGANEGFPLPGAGGEEIECCGPEWAAAYANRVRRMMDTYRQDGAARVYWLTLPLPRDGDLAEVARSVNAAIEVAAQPFRAHVRVLDMAELFTPDGYRDAMTVDGRRRIVRDADGIHLNPAGAALAAEVLLEAVRQDFG